MQVTVDSGISELLSITDDSVEVAFWGGEEVCIVHENSTGKVVPSPNAEVDERPRKYHPGRTRKEFECSGNASPLGNPENISFLPHIQPRIYNNWFCPLKLLPPNITSMIDEIEIPGYIRERMQQIVLSNKWVIRSTEIDEPIPIAALLQQDGSCVERIGHHGRTPVGNEISLGDHADITDGGKDGVILNKVVEIEAFFR